MNKNNESTGLFNIRNKLLGMSIGVITVLILVIIYQIFALRTAERALEEVDVQIHMTEHANDIVIHTMEVQELLTDGSLVQDEEQVENAKVARDEAIEHVEEYIKMVKQHEEDEEINVY